MLGWFLSPAIVLRGEKGDLEVEAGSRLSEGEVGSGIGLRMYIG